MEEMADCLQLLEKLMIDPSAEIFNKPVDWEKDNIPLYPQIIKKPMDFGTIKEMLQANVLANPEHFRQHVLLVFQNAFQFNTDAAPAFLYAKRMEKEFNRLWDEMIARWKQEALEKKDDDKQQESDREKLLLQDQITEMRTKIDLTTRQIKEIQDKRNEQNNQAGSGVVKRVKMKKPAAPLTMKQKEDLCVKIGELNEYEQAELIKLVSPTSDEENEFTLNFATLDDTTILTIQKFVHDCMKSRRKNSQSQGKKRNRT